MNERRTGIATSIKDRLLRLSDFVLKKHEQKENNKKKQPQEAHRVVESDVDNADAIDRSEGRAFRGPFGIR